MPWFGTQGIVLTGEFLGRFLGANSDLSRFMPGPSADPREAQLLRALVYLFPASGLLSTALSILGAFWLARSRLLNLAIGLLGLIPLVALIAGTSRLPPGSSQEVGLRVIAAGSVAVLLGAVLDRLWNVGSRDHVSRASNSSSSV